ncbi:MAG: glycerate kinase [Roseburia sp.]|nr:glycerate kinase [Roseburia sp.]
MPNVELKPGIAIVLDAIGLEKELADADIKITELWISEDVRPGRGDEKWLNLILQKSDTV